MSQIRDVPAKMEMSLLDRRFLQDFPWGDLLGFNGQNGGRNGPGGGFGERLGDLLLDLPRVVGLDPESGDEITAQNGRYGPYLKKGADTRTLPSEDAIFEIGLDGAVELFAQPK